MAGLFGLLTGNNDPNAINQTYGVPQGIVDNANSDSMIGLGGLLMAAGQRQTPQQRAQMLSQLGNAVAAGDRSLYTGAQSYLMGKKASTQYTTETDKDGNIWQVNKANGDRDLLKSAPNPLANELLRAKIEQTQETVKNPYEIEKLKKQADSEAKQQEMQQNTIQSSQNLLPLYQRARDIYAQLQQKNGLGPLQALSGYRTAQAAIGSENEALRQEYEQIINELNLSDAQKFFKGQGAVSDFERKILSSIRPTLSASKGDPGINTWDRQINLLQRRSKGDFSPLNEKDFESKDDSNNQAAPKKFPKWEILK
jgi:hypothetical protein